MSRIRPEKAKATAWGLLLAGVLGILIVVGSRNLDHFDAALVGYTFATLFATFGVTYRYAMWLQRPPTRLYWRRGWQVFLNRRFVGSNLLEFLRRFFLEFAANRFIFRRGRLRGAAHWLIMRGCIMAALITFPRPRPLLGIAALSRRADRCALRRARYASRPAAA